MPSVAHCEDVTSGIVAGVLSCTGESEAAGGCGNCLWLVAGVSDAGNAPSLIKLWLLCVAMDSVHWCVSWKY